MRGQHPGSRQGYACLVAVTLGLAVGCDTSKAPPRTSDTIVPGADTGGAPAESGSGGTGGDVAPATGGAAGAVGVGVASGGSGGPPASMCSFASTYIITESTGLVGTIRTTVLSPPMKFFATGRSFGADAGSSACMPPLPTCKDDTHVDVSDIEAALGDPDVRVALATNGRPMYGDSLVADGPSFGFSIPNGHGFSVGIECMSLSATCTPTPPGVKNLVQLLRLLLTQQLADPSCAGI